MSRRVAALLALVAASTAAGQEASAPDKSRYTLFNPTPRSQWRPLSADRPDITESPYTVDAGAVQLEMSYADYAKNGAVEVWSIAPANLKLGVLNNVDLQLIFIPYVHENGDGTHRGFGDMQLRAKVNLWGNDGGATAFAVMPFIKLPTATGGVGNEHVEGGLIFPFATDLTEQLSLGLMLETDVVYDDSGEYAGEFVTTAALGLDITGQWGLYVEGVGIASTRQDYRALLGVGATYALTDNLVLDAGINIGLAGDADDVNLFSGLTVRF